MRSPGYNYDVSLFRRDYSFRIILVYHSFHEANLLGTLARFFLRGVIAMIRSNTPAGLQINRGCDTDEVRDLIVTDETAATLRILSVQVNRHIDGGTHAGQHLELDITNRIDGISAQLFKDMGRAGVPVTGMGRNLEMDICRDIAFLPSLTERPKQAFIINQESPDTQAASTADFLNTSSNLFLTAKAISHTLSFLGLHGSRSIRSSARTACEHQLYLPFLGILDHLLNLIISQEHNALSLGNSMDLDPIFVKSFQQRFHRARPLDTRYFKPILTTIRKTFFRGRKIVQITTRHAYTLEELPGIFHCVILHILNILVHPIRIHITFKDIFSFLIENLNRLQCLLHLLSKPSLICIRSQK